MDNFKRNLDKIKEYFKNTPTEEVKLCLEELGIQNIKVDKECEYCNNQKKIRSSNYCGEGIAKIVGTDIEIYEQEQQRSFKIQFCPMCSRKLGE